MADVSIMRAIQGYSGLFWSRASGRVLLPQSWPSRLSGLLAGPPRGRNWGMVHRKRSTPPPLVLMCQLRSHNIPDQVGTACKDLGRSRWHCRRLTGHSTHSDSAHCSLSLRERPELYTFTLSELGGGTLTVKVHCSGPLSAALSLEVKPGVHTQSDSAL